MIKGAYVKSDSEHDSDLRQSGSDGDQDAVGGKKLLRPKAKSRSPKRKHEENDDDNRCILRRRIEDLQDDVFMLSIPDGYDVDHDSESYTTNVDELSSIFKKLRGIVYGQATSFNGGLCVHEIASNVYVPVARFAAGLVNASVGQISAIVGEAERYLTSERDRMALHEQYIHDITHDSGDIHETDEIRKLRQNLKMTQIELEKSQQLNKTTEHQLEAERIRAVAIKETQDELVAKLRQKSSGTRLKTKGPLDRMRSLDLSLIHISEPTRPY